MSAPRRPQDHKRAVKARPKLRLVNVVVQANFVLDDVEVVVNIIHPHLNNIAIDLVSPSGITVRLLRNQIDPRLHDIGQPGHVQAAGRGQGHGAHGHTVADAQLRPRSHRA